MIPWLRRRDGKWRIAWVVEVPGVNSQGETRDELLSNLRETHGREDPAMLGFQRSGSWAQESAVPQSLTGDSSVVIRLA